MANNLLQKIFSNNKTRVFLFFLIISSGSLLMNKLSKNYRTVLQFEIVPQQIPSDKIVLQQDKNYLTIFVNASGFNLIGYKFWKKKIGVNATEATKVYGTTYKIETYKLIEDFQKQLSSDTEIVEILDKTIFIEMGSIISKKIPVVLNSSISYEKGYKIKGEVKLSPDSILVFGPENLIVKIDKIETNQLSLNNVYENVEEIVNLKITPEFDSVKLSHDKVSVKAEVEKFTELSFMIPLKLVNKPMNCEIEVFPSEIQIVFQVELSEITNIKDVDFEVVCDVQYALDKKVNYLLPKVVKKPKSVHNFHINPTKIDYIKRQ